MLSSRFSAQDLDRTFFNASARVFKPWVFGPAPAPAQIVAIIHSMIDVPGLLI